MRHSATRYSIAALLTLACAQGAYAQPGIPRTNTPSPDAEIYLVPLTFRGDTVRAGVPANLTRRAGYDNQPMFARDSRSLFYTANLGDGHTDIWRLDLSTGLSRPVQNTKPESEYSAAPILGDTTSIAVIRVEADSTQRLWRLPMNGSAPSVLIPDLKPVGYFAQPDDSTWVTFVLGSPATLHVSRTGRTGSTTMARDIGRSLHRIPGTRFVSFVQKGAQPWHVMRLDVNTNRIDTLVALPEGTEDVTWVDSTTMLTGSNTKLLQWTRGSGSARTAWREVGDFGFAHLARISRMTVSPSRAWLAIVAEAQPRSAAAASTSPAAKWVDRIDTTRVRRAISILAADSMEGRLTGSPGMERAAKWIEQQYKAVGLAPAGDSGTYRQHIPLRTAQGPNSTGRARPAPVESWAAWNALPADQRLRTQNIAGVLRGSDPSLRDEVVLVTAHYDHIGIGRAVDGDSINNGADDDASGNVALIEIARALQNGPRPKRTILFMAITGEEVGGIGTRWYLQHPLLPLEKTVVDLNVEMIAHADSIAGGFGRAWLTGYERSTLGDLLADNGIPLMPDPRPGQSFFTRSDNAAFARIGIPAHSLSSFNLATPYHHPKDEAGIVNVAHMSQVISATAKAVRLLADGDKPTWHPGGKPEPRPAR
ncbi:MAG: M20/M25/M40 family metallo-hydrolase [Gemmatimonadaceae bacterium]|nr:M20/M25/M40 family metallo-hydrolase [Gemmatimonadaceae bacterium]